MYKPSEARYREDGIGSRKGADSCSAAIGANSVFGSGGGVNVLRSGFALAPMSSCSR
jgi:hypothetical protein